MRLPFSPTGDRPLVIDEYRIDPELMPNRYKATIAMRYTREAFAEALFVAHTFLKTKFDALVVSGNSGSPNGDQITVWFWAVGRKPSTDAGPQSATLTEQHLAADADPRRI